MSPSATPSNAEGDEAPAITIDLDRRRRCGYPEVIYGPGKTIEQLVAIVRLLLDHHEPVLATRIDSSQAAGLLTAFPNGRFNEVARTFRISHSTTAPSRSSAPGSAGGSSDNVAVTVNRSQSPPAAPAAARQGFVAVISAGTGDLPVAEEARETLDWMGIRTAMIHDVGVAGPHRLPARLAEFEHAEAIVVVAGMEGALPSVVAGYVSCPVVAVPTSVGYGANFNGLSALLSMLNSCANNVAVVNIDAGFKAGFLAGMIAAKTNRQPNR